MRLLVTCVLLLAILPLARAGEKQPEIVIESSDPAVSANIRHHLSVTGEPCSSPPLLPRYRKRIRKEVDAAARALGYYHARIAELVIRRQGGCWQLKLNVDPGPRVHIENLDIRILGEAADDPAFTRLLQEIPLKPGAPLVHSEYEKIKLQLKSLALRRGYFDAVFSIHELKVDVNTNRALIHLVLDSGPRYRFGAITIRQDILDPDFVRRYVNLAPGEPYTSAAVTSLYQRFADSGLFRYIKIDTHPNPGPPPQVPLSLSLVAKKKHRYSLGVGFETNTGPRATFNYLNRYLNRRGHQFNLELRFTPVEPRATATYTIPLWDPLKESLRFNAGYRRQDVDSFLSEQATVNTVFTQLLGEWTETLSLNLNFESSRVGNEKQIQSLVLLPAIGWTQKTSEVERGLIVKGHKFDFKLGTGLSLLGNSSHFVKVRLFGRYVFSLPWKARILHRWEIGALATPAFGRLTASQRFFAGGDNSIRGYQYLSQGPVDADGKVIGGRYLGVVSLEYEQTVVGKWGLALFVDGGNAYDQLRHLWRDRRFGGGIGFRWLSPVGLVRLDFAVPINHRVTEDFRIHFAIGPVL